MLDMWAALTHLIALSLAAIATEAIVEILVSSALLDIIGIRPWAAKKAIPIDGNYTDVKWYHTALYKLLTCGYCSSVSVAFILSLIIFNMSLVRYPWDNIIINTFVVHRLSNIIHVQFELLRRGRVNSIDLVISGKLETNNARTISGGDGEAGEEIR